MSMELTRVTKLLLWLLSKRPDIGEMNVREAEQLGWEQALELEELYADLSPEEQRLLQIDYFNDCFTKSIDDSAA